MLTQMFELQESLQEVVGSDVQSQEFRNMTALALSSEIHEALGETPWKPWKKKQKLNVERYKGEIVDCWAFLINLTFPVMDAKELFDRFVEKNEINVRRQMTGY